MTNYVVSNTAGSFVKSTVDGANGGTEVGVGKADTTDTAAIQVRPVAIPRAASNKSITTQ